ncbi:MAG: MnhB domain-containing protein [Sulfuricurvum sp.]|nr:MnhB domain-containing protein [Sulfuricurvum sp.]MDP3023813.1 MnhB domain-containing protein [Sulfuricurvum sp.]MDP3120497.1 MnhB domain-containing protein [Sulfuricurvum sp.]
MRNKTFHSLLYFLAFWLFVGLSFILTNINTLDSSMHTKLFEAMPHSGVTHEVTAVLLNFRALDTLLEVGVILLSLIAIHALEPNFRYTPLSFENTITNTFVAILFPLIALYAFYILYSGSYQSGGAFSASALLAGGIIILRLVKPRSFFVPKELILRFLYVSGLFYFVCVGMISLFFGSFLEYRDYIASFYIISIESVLMLSLGAILSAYFINAVQRVKP